MEQVNYKDIIAVLMNITQDSELGNIVSVSGGIVPWLVSKNDSKRKHDDIDFLILKNDMPKIRAFLLKNNLYDASLDSLSYKEASMVDYGVNTYISNIPVGFFPYEQIEDNSIIQRSFYSDKINGKKNLKIKEIPNIKITDYLSKTILPSGNVISISSLEIIKATKENALRKKDIYDIKEIDRIGYDLEKYERVKKAISDMKSTFYDII